MVWHDLLFAHWPCAAEVLQPRLPVGLALDTFDGRAWLGVVPFRMSGIRPRCLPPIPGLRAFSELNVRTCAVAEGKPGVWFLTLDASSQFAVRCARTFYHLPYRDARITCSALADGWIHYQSHRHDRRHPPAEFRARYRSKSSAEAVAADPAGPPVVSLRQNCPPDNRRNPDSLHTHKGLPQAMAGGERAA
jgi:uncharacterized protein